MPTLSICIPTFNRSLYLSELLDSIVAQNLPDVQVVISNDASPDDTVEVIARYRAAIADLIVVHQPSNIGLDKNFIEVTRAATGDYLWLMGDDDQLEPEGAQTVLDALKHWPDVTGLTLGVVDYDPAMKLPTGIRGMPESQLLSGAGEVFSKIAEHLGFMSAMVVRRQDWERASAEPSAREMNNLYSQVYIAGLALGESGVWGVVKTPCVRFRSDNDQFKKRLGWFDRLKVDVDGYDEIADRLFAGDQVAHRSMRKRVFDTHVLARLINLKTSATESAPLFSVAEYLFAHYKAMPNFWKRALPLLIVPRSALRLIRIGYKRFSHASGAARVRRNLDSPTSI